ncbi:histidine phosphatase family protein [Acholeplasma granularum]|uniref:histidine phosphatase family protein n=1 Tax=Acholeplasma granularum TaxID=264635 RepID=UPI00046E84C6|nr:histidine phosphatase family protein [Acholeplasma granularum]
MILAMVRHGETDYNKKRLVQGNMDNPLNETGIEQAHKLGRYLKEKNERFNYLISSPLIRAQKTAQIVGKYIDLDISEINSDYLERNFGPFEGGVVKDVLPIITKHNFRQAGYEDNEQLIKRISDAVNKTYSNHHDKKVMVVAHAHVIKSLLILADFDKYDYFNHFVGNLSIVYFDIEPNKIKVLKQIDL